MIVYRRTRRKNARKMAVLGVLARLARPCTYNEVADWVGLPGPEIARDLQRYTRFGYVRRWKLLGQKFEYKITRRGLARLSYFRETIVESR
jgi:DNA-binding IclR family transcriptional regulator